MSYCISTVFIVKSLNNVGKLTHISFIPDTTKGTFLRCHLLFSQSPFGGSAAQEIFSILEKEKRFTQQIFGRR